MINRAHIRWKDYSGAGAKNGPQWPRFLESKYLLSEGLWFHLTAFFFGMASINRLYPFGLSYLAASMLHGKQYISAGFMAFLGILISIKNPAAFRYLGAMILFAACFNLLISRTSHRELATGIIVFASNALAGLLYLSFVGISLYDLLLLGMESILTGIATFIIPAGLSWFFKVPVGEEEKNLCFTILAGVGLSIAGNLEFYKISIKSVISVLAVLVMAMLQGPGAGAVTGIIMGIMGFSFTMSPWFVTILAFSGLLAGTFNKLGKLGTIFGFALGYLLYNFYINCMGESLIPWQVLAASCVIMMTMPAGLFKRVEIFFNETAGQSRRDKTDIVKAAKSRLLKTASLLEELGRAFKEPLASNSNPWRGGYMEYICQEVRQGVCFSCGLYKICWEREFHKTVKSLCGLVKSCAAAGSSSIPNIFRVRCGKLEDIRRIINELRRIYDLEKHLYSIAECGREKIWESFQEASDLVRELVRAMDDDYPNLPDEERSVNLGVAVGVAGVAKEGFGVSGDDFYFSELKGGKFMLALSDGMGVGENAAKCSKRTLALLERFLDAGFDCNKALRIINSAIVASSIYDRFSTVDMVLIDTMTGIADFIKAGSAASFVKRGSRVETIKGGSLPVGIMDEVNPKITSRDLKSGDVLVMVTDGVIDALSGSQDGEEQLKNLLADIRTANPQEIAEDVLRKARLGGNARDDMTVLAARLWGKMT
ncbi:MAG: stage sporulation protein [Tepidanaerobacteraceae bacterium]|nr:stage sporulation protein [Tepidanaerobacteraceae bacterium]